MDQSYTPSDKILQKYASLIVNFGMQTRDGKKLHKGASVRFVVPEVAKPMYYHLQQEILKAGFNPIGVYLPDNDDKYKFDFDFYQTANNDQINFYAKDLNDGIVKQIDGSIRIIADSDPNSLKNADQKKVITKSNSSKEFKDAFFKKVDSGKLAWTLALYGTDAMASEANMTSKMYWQQIIKACYLDSADPTKEWFKINKTVQKTADGLSDMSIVKVLIKGNDVNLEIGIGEDRKWVAGGGNNIPSYEVFTSPNYRQVNGWIKFNQPHFKYGSRIDGIKLEFKEGQVVKFEATDGYELLKNMLKTKGGNFLGEFSLTDARLSRITKPMAEILFDENMGGKYGNTHVALGSSFHDCYKFDGSKFNDKKWDKLGYNNSTVHSDLISTTNRTVTATLADGSTKVIYKNGQFTFV